MKYLRIFNTTNERDAALANVDHPVLSFLADPIENETSLSNHNIPVSMPKDEIWYTTINNKPIDDTEFEYDCSQKFGVDSMISHTYQNGKGVIKFSGPIEYYQFSFANVAGFTYYRDLYSLTLPVNYVDYTCYLSSFVYTCPNLTQITFVVNDEDAVLFIDDVNPAIRDCPNLSRIIVKGNGKYTSGNNCNAIIDTETNKLLLGCNDTTIPYNVTNIGIWPFYNMKLGLIKIPSSVTSIHESAFWGEYGNNNIHDIVCEPIVPPTIELYDPSEGFMTLQLSDTCRIHVPEQSLNAYKTALGWSSVASQIQAM